MKHAIQRNGFTSFATLCVAIACLFILILHGGGPQ